MTPFLCIATLSLYISYIKRFAVYVPLTLLVLCQFMCVPVCGCVRWHKLGSNEITTTFITLFNVAGCRTISIAFLGISGAAFCQPKPETHPSRSNSMRCEQTLESHKEMLACAKLTTNFDTIPLNVWWRFVFRHFLSSYSATNVLTLLRT